MLSALRMRTAQRTEILSHMSELKPLYTYISSDDLCLEQQLLPEYDPTIRRRLEFLMTSLS